MGGPRTLKWFKFAVLKRGDVARLRGHLWGAEVRNHLLCVYHTTKFLTRYRLPYSRSSIQRKIPQILSPTSSSTANGFYRLPKPFRHHSCQYLYFLLWRRTCATPISNNGQARHSPSCRRKMGYRSSIYERHMGRHSLHIPTFPYAPSTRPLEQLLHVYSEEREKSADHSF
jgi:hypothetical protein